MKQIKSYRSCPTFTGLPLAGIDRGRILRETSALANRREHRRCLTAGWHNRRHLCR